METITAVHGSKLKPGQQVRIIIEGPVQTPYEHSGMIRVFDTETSRVVNLSEDRTVSVVEES